MSEIKTYDHDEIISIIAGDKNRDRITTKVIGSRTVFYDGDKAIGVLSHKTKQAHAIRKNRRIKLEIVEKRQKRETEMEAIYGPVPDSVPDRVV